MHRAIADQEKRTSRGNGLAQELEKGLGFGIQPEQVLKNDYEWLVQTLAHQQALYGL